MAERCSDHWQLVVDCIVGCIYGNVNGARNPSWSSKLSVAFLLDAALVFNPMNIQFDGLTALDYLRGIRDGNIIPTIENLRAALRELINATERQDTADVGVIELPPFPFHREA